MLRYRFAGIAVAISLEVAIWLAAPLIFLYFYLRFSVTSTAAVAPHLLILFLVFLVLGALQVCFALLLDDNWIVRGVAALLYASVLFLECLYYPLVIAGLNAWGQVISWDLIRSYTLQAPALADALGVSITLSLALLCGTFATMLGLAWWYVNKIDWPRTIVAYARRHHHVRNLTILLAGIFMVCGLVLTDIFHSPLRDTTEPLVTTFFPNVGVRGFRGFAADAKAGDKLDRESDAARAIYQPNASAKKKI
jgi:hypothetical protein